MQLEDVYHKDSGTIEYRYGVMRYTYDEESPVISEIDEEIIELEKDISELKNVLTVTRGSCLVVDSRFEEVHGDGNMYYLVLFPGAHSFYNSMRVNGEWKKMKFYAHHSADIYDLEYIDYEEVMLEPTTKERDISDIKEQITLKEARVHFLGEIKRDIESTKAVLK